MFPGDDARLRGNVVAAPFVVPLDLDLDPTDTLHGADRLLELGLDQVPGGTTDAGEHQADIDHAVCIDVNTAHHAHIRQQAAAGINGARITLEYMVHCSEYASLEAAEQAQVRFARLRPDHPFPYIQATRLAWLREDRVRLEQALDALESEFPDDRTVRAMDVLVPRIGEIIGNQLERPSWHEGNFFGDTFSR